MSKKIAVVAGCTGCDTCRWLCKADAITYDHKGAHVVPEKCVGCVEDNLASIDYSKCVGCGVCADNCQSYAIRMVEI